MKGAFSSGASEANDGAPSEWMLWKTEPAAQVQVTVPPTPMVATFGVKLLLATVIVMASGGATACSVKVCGEPVSPATAA